MINRLIVVLIVAMPLTFILVCWPVVFAAVGGGLCCLALVVTAVQIVTSAPRVQAPDRRAAASRRRRYIPKHLEHIIIG